MRAVQEEIEFFTISKNFDQLIEQLEKQGFLIRSLQFCHGYGRPDFEIDFWNHVGIECFESKEGIRWRFHQQKK